MKRFMHAIGAFVLTLLHDIGGYATLLYDICRGIIRGEFDMVEFWRSMYRLGVLSFTVVAATSFIVGGITAIQTSSLVAEVGATSVVGGSTGTMTLRAIGPILIGIMFAGRVGANNTAELGTMAVTDQIDALRALAINPVNYLLAPRFVAIVIMMFCLTVIGEIVAIVSASSIIYLLMGLDPRLFYDSFAQNVQMWDFLSGIIKATSFGVMIGLVSNYYGITTTGGAVGVGRAVNSAVVASAVSIFVFDFVLTSFLP